MGFLKQSTLKDLGDTRETDVQMDAKLTSPFIDSTLYVLETMANTRVSAGDPYVKKDQIARGDVTGIIGLIGEMSGTVAVSFTEKSILAIVSDMFGEEMKQLGQEIEDAVGEIANMISGQARQKLEELGLCLLKSDIPTVLTGKHHKIMHIATSPIIAIPFSTENGEFTVEVCLRN